MKEGLYDLRLLVLGEALAMHPVLREQRQI